MSSRLPRGVRVPAILLVAMLVATTLGWGLFVYNPAPEEPQRPSFLSAPGQPLPAPAQNASYRVTVRFRSAYPGQDDYVVVRQKEYMPGRTPVVKDSQIATGGEVVQSVTYRTGSSRYVRKTYDDRQSFRRKVDRRGVVRVDWTTLTSYQVEQSDTGAAKIEPGKALRALYMLRYRKVGTTTYENQTVVKYVPVTGWTTRNRLDEAGGHQSLYVREASGVVLVDPDNGAIVKADVTGSVIEADTWSDVMTGEVHTIVIEYEVDTGIETVQQPPWVRSLNTSDGASLAVPAT